MEIISHRGYWLNSKEKNTKKAFLRSFQNSFGTEADIRDLKSELVISHDIANELSLSLIDFLLAYKHNNHNLPLALNIKADGLQEYLLRIIKQYEISNYFFFDMSIPDTISYIKAGLNVFCRQSEYEPYVAFYEKIQGIWLDAFEEIWYTEKIVKKHLDAGKKVCVVSAELHNRNHLEHWKLLKNMTCISNKKLILCTDYPLEAQDFFN